MATIKQKLAMTHIANGDSVSKAMRKAGYKPTTAKNPKNLTERPSFIDFLENHGITDDKLADRLNGGLDATKPIYRNNNETKQIELVDEVPDWVTRHPYIETSLKLKGHHQKTQTNVLIIPIYGGLSARPDEVQVS